MSARYTVGVMRDSNQGAIVDTHGHADAEYHEALSLAETARRLNESESMISRCTSLNAEVNERGELEAAAIFEGEGVRMFAAHMVKWFYENGGNNFIAMEMRDPKTNDAFELTMRRANGKTPAQALGEMRTLLREIYDADQKAVAEMRAAGIIVDDLIDPRFAHRIEEVLNLPSTRRIP